MDPSVTDQACAGLNGMQLGDRYLVVQRAALGANPQKRSAMMDGADAILPPSLARVAPSVLGAGDGEAASSRVLQMLNMVTPEELVDDQEYEEIVEDIKDECGKYGEVVDVKIPRPMKNDKGKMDAKGSEGVEGLGRVFVMYSSVDGAEQAMRAIAGRQFGGRWSYRTQQRNGILTGLTILYRTLDHLCVWKGRTDALILSSVGFRTACFGIRRAPPSGLSPVMITT